MQSSGEAGLAPNAAVPSPAPPAGDAGAWEAAEAGAEVEAPDSAGLDRALADAPPAEALAGVSPAEALAGPSPAEALAGVPPAGVPPAGADDLCGETELEEGLA